MQRTTAAGRRRLRLPRRGAGRADPGRHVPRRQELRCVDVDHRPAGLELRRFGQQGLLVRRLSRFAPGPQRLLQQPEAAHVAEVADPAVHPALVGEVGGPARLGEDRLVQLDPDQGPGAGRDVRERIVRGRHPDHRGCGVVRPHRDHGRRGGQTGVLGHGRAEGADRLPWLDQRREQVGRKVERGEELGRPGAGPGVQQSGGRGVGDLGTPFAGQPEGQQVGQQQGLPGPPPPRPALLGGELVESVERQELQAADRVQLGRVHPGVHVVDDRLGPVVPIRDRLGQQPAVGAQQTVVDRPGVDAQADDVRVTLGQRGEPDQNLLVQAGQVPAKMPVRDGRPVGEAVHHLEVHSPVGPPPGHHPATRRPDVDGPEHRLVRTWLSYSASRF